MAYPAPYLMEFVIGLVLMWIMYRYAWFDSVHFDWLWLCQNFLNPFFTWNYVGICNSRMWRQWSSIASITCKHYWGPFYQHGFILILAWISNYIHWKGWNYLSIPKLQRVSVWKWISYFIPHFTGHVITYHCWNRRQSIWIKGHLFWYRPFQSWLCRDQPPDAMAVMQLLSRACSRT